MQSTVPRPRGETSTGGGGLMLKGLLFFNLFFVVNQTHFPWGTGITGLAPANILMLAIYLVMRGKPDPLSSIPPMLLRPLLIFGGVMIFALLWGQVRNASHFVDDLTYVKNAIFFQRFYFVYLRCRQDQKTTRQLIIAIMVIAALAGLEAVKEGLAYGIGAYNPMKRASGPFGDDWRNANRAGVFYAMFTPMFVALILFLKGKKLWRIAAVGGALMVIAGALFTYSRQAYFLIVLAIAVLLVRKSIIATGIIAVILISLTAYLPDSVTQRIDETKQVDRKSGVEHVDESTSSRWEIWEGAMGMLKENPIGVGANHFKDEIGKYCAHAGYDAHNFYVLTVAEAGPQGLVSLLFLMGTLFFGLATFLRQKMPPDDPEAKALALGFTVCTVCMALGGIYGSPTLEGAVMAPYWALCGLLERYAHLKMLSSTDGTGGIVIIVKEPTLAERFPLVAHLQGGRRR